MSSSAENDPFNASQVKLQSREGCFRRLLAKVYPVGFLVEFQELFALAWPAVVTSFLQFFLQTVSIIVCGHLDKLFLDAAALANSMINVMGIAIGMGLSTACDTFFSQTYGSANKKQMGIYLQRSLLIINAFAIAICCVHINMESILNLIGQEPEISKLAGDYMLCFLPGVLFDFNFLIFARYLQNQNIVYPSMLCAVLGNVFNITSQLICIYVLKFSYLSSAICQASSLGIMFLSQLIYILKSKVYVTTWDGWNIREAFSGWGMFVRLAIPGVFMIGLEEWSFEIATILSGLMDSVQLGIQGILFQVEAMTYMIPLGCSIAVNIRIGQHLGASRPEHAKTTYRIGLTVMLVSATIVGALALTLRNYIPMIFSDDPPIIEGAASVLILSAFFQYADGFSATSSGALRGCGKQLTGAVLLFFGYYVISLPIGITLAFVAKMDVYGLWLGLLIGISLEAVVFVIVVLRIDWIHQSKRAQIVAYGGADVVGPLEDLDKLHSATETEQEDEPLLPTSRRKRSRHSSVRSSRRASISIPDHVSITTNQETTTRLLCKRLAVLFFILTVVLVSVILRVFQPASCVPTDKITEDYAGILPLCNRTINSTIFL